MMRLCSVGVDLGLCGTLVGFMQHWLRLSQPLVLLPIYAAYFIGLELWQGRTIGKMVFGWRLCTPSGAKPAAPLLILRTFLRCAGPIGFFFQTQTFLEQRLVTPVRWCVSIGGQFVVSFNCTRIVLRIGRGHFEQDVALAANCFAFFPRTSRAV